MRVTQTHAIVVYRQCIDLRC